MAAQIKQKSTEELSYRHFLDVKDLDANEIGWILRTAKDIKSLQDLGGHRKYLAGKQLAMIFEKSSTRTRISFEVAMNHLGGNALYLSGKDSQIGRGEPIMDTAKVLSRYVDMIMIRTFEHTKLEELANHASVPVINGLTDASHPCQIIADILTVEESLGSIKGKKIAWFGDVNNVLNSWIEAADILGFELRIAAPKELTKKIKFKNNIKYFEKAEDAAKGADVITTDTWISMGEDEENKAKKNKLKPYQVNKKLMALAAKNAIFLHCLPAHRGEEVTADIIDGKQSKIYDEAENRLHAQKAIILWCFKVDKL
ncbi:MAG TPA: ornithine carbamoyltransferase [Alphaproteobacteria bacterium]|nr:ornithine carbamoyltransferase [Alphaproteobacteria bacterium]